MGSIAQLFAGSNFRITMNKYCANHGWRISDLNDRRAILRFSMNSGRSQTLYVIKYDATLEFSVPSGLSFHTIEDVPHFISTLLLKRSSEKKIGFWCIEEINGHPTYSCMHNAEIDLIDNRYFGNVVETLVNECDELEGVVLNMLQR